MAEGAYSIRSVERVCDLLDLIQAQPGSLTLAELAESTELPKSSTFRYLQTLEDRGYVQRNASGGYSVGVALRTERVDAIVDRARPLLAELRDQLGETVNIGRFDAGEIVYLDVAESTKPVRNSVNPGDRENIHSTALGKAIAAEMSTDEVVRVLERHGMRRLTDKTITSVDEFLAQIAQVRAVGYAIDEQENEPDGRCVAVVIHGTAVPMAISLSAPSFRLGKDRVPEVAALLREAADKISPSNSHGKGEQRK